MKTISDMDVTYVDHMGSDLSVVNAARVSFDKVSEEFNEKDAKLLKYLAKHDHWSPFAHTSISLRIKAPIFVARQLGKHQVGLVWNEVSRRYVDSTPEFYLPDSWRMRAENVKQGSDQTRSIDEEIVNTSSTLFSCLDLYEDMLDSGICPEQARMVLPQSMMTEWIWTGSLLAFIRVCKLRCDDHTQKETRDMAYMILEILHNLFPSSTGVFFEDT